MALLNAFPSRAELSQMVSFVLDKNLEEIAGNGDNAEVAFKLIIWAESKGKLEGLIQGAREKNSGNQQLRVFAEQVLATRSTSVPSAQQIRFPEACEFDLDSFMEDECLPALEGKQGLIGLIIPCAEEAFRVKFCDRLRKELGRSNIAPPREPLQLDPYISVVEAIARINRYKSELLRNKDVICPISISIFDHNSTVPDTFWQGISENFKETDLECSLILVMYGRKNAVFPTGPIRLSAPEFRAVHVHRWVVRISKALGWTDQDRDAWKRIMIKRCCNDFQNGLLDIREVYEHLDLAILLLQQNLSVAQFLEELELGG